MLRLKLPDVQTTELVLTEQLIAVKIIIITREIKLQILSVYTKNFPKCGVNRHFQAALAIPL